ncbi:MAG: hypothetical protein AABY22_07625 [Nanoarchaeota archaeon]
MKKTICMDLDGVITDYKNWYKRKENLSEAEVQFYSQKIGMIFWRLKPIEGIAEAIKELRKTYRIIIYTARGKAFRGLTSKWLKKHNISYDRLIMNKPMAHIYIDDLAFEFKENKWDTTTIKEITEFLEHN